jgi:hypothetical protein
MRIIRRTLAAAAAPLLVVGLAACGGAEAPEGTESAPTAETSAEGSPPEETSEATGEETEQSDPAEEDTSAEEETTGAEDEDPSEDGSGDEESGEGTGGTGTTAVEHLWVDDSWEIQEVDDLCGEMDLSPAPYSDQEGFFTCGPTAASALACQVEGESLVHCITNGAGRTALSFTSDRAAESAGAMPANEEALPLLVTLPGDVTCEPLAHDHDEHFEGMVSWYDCSDGSELLTDEDIMNTFAVEGGTWTVQRSMDQGAPEAVVAETVTFAGTE